LRERVLNMALKLSSGTLIAYGPILPDNSSSIDGSLFYKTDSLIGGAKGLYVFGFTADSNPGSFGPQVSQGWTKASADAVDADTLDGFDSSYFQAQNTNLDALSLSTGTGFFALTASGTGVTRTITAGSSKISITNGSGISGNPTIDITESNLVLSNMSGVLGVTHGGTGITSVPSIGGVLYGASSSSLAYSGVGSASTGTGTTQNWQILSSSGAGAPIWVNSTSLNVAHASTANTANTADVANTANTASTVAWSGISSKPTTLAGYGITDDIPDTTYVDTVDYLNLPPLAGILKDNTVPIYTSFDFSLGVWGDSTYTMVDNVGRTAVFYSVTSPTGNHQVFRMYRYSDNDSFIYDNQQVSPPFLLGTEKVNYIMNLGTYFAVLYITTKTFPETLARVVIVKTQGSSDCADWTLGYDVTSLYTSKVNFGLVQTNSGDRILRTVVSSSQDIVTLQVYNSSLSLLRSQEIYNKSTDVTMSDASEIPATSMVPGTKYLISSVGSTNFMLYGASANTVGTSFTATAAGTGTGKVSQRIAASFALLNYSVKGICYPFTWNPYMETFHVLFSSYYVYATPSVASTSFSWGLHVSWDIPKTWIESGTGTPQNKIPVKSNGYRYSAQPDSSWNTNDGGMVSSWAFGQTNSSIITDEYSGDLYLSTKPSFTSSSVGTIRRLSYKTVSAPGLISGNQYSITSIGTTDFTLYGASVNTVGTTFIATGLGAGTGTADAIVPSVYKTFGSNLTNNATLTITPAIPDGSAWAKTIDSYWGHIIGNNILFHATSSKYSAALIQATFSTTNFSSIAQGQTDDTLKLDSPSALVNPQQTSAYPAVVAANMFAGKHGTVVISGVPTYYFIHPGALIYTITASGTDRYFTSTGLTVPALPTSIGSETGLVDACVSGWNGNAVSPIYLAIVTNINGAHLLMCSNGTTWVMASANIHQTQIDLGKTARGNTTNLINFGISAGNTLITENGRFLYHFGIPSVSSTSFYYGVFDTFANTVSSGSVNTWSNTSTGSGGYDTQNGYPGASWGYSSNLGYYHFQSTIYYNSAYFLSSKDIRTGASITEDQWFNGAHPRYQIYLSTESATGLVAYVTPYPIFIGGYYCSTPNQSISLTANSTNYVYASKRAGDRTTVDIIVSSTLLAESFNRVLLSSIVTNSTSIVSQQSYSIREHDKIEELEDVSIQTKNINDTLIWNGTAWVTKASSSAATSNSIAVRDTNSDLAVRYINQSSPNNETDTISQFIINNGLDGVLKKVSALTAGSALRTISALTGAVSRLISSKLADIVTPQDFGATGNGTTDDTVALQAFIDACSSTTGIGPMGYIPAGQYKFTSSLIFKQIFCNLFGAGQDASVFQFLPASASTAPAFTTSALTYFKPTWSNFSIQSTVSTGKCINFNNVSSEVYAGSFTNIKLHSIGTCMYIPRIFSFKFDSVGLSSTNDHGCIVACGPAVTWINCYAYNCGASKAGYRLAGGINMIGCNGIDSGGYWGIFGCNIGASDGFQSDFPSTDYPDINLDGCNVEFFEHGGILVHNSYKSFVFNTGKIDRSAKSTDFLYMIGFSAPGISTKGPIINPGVWIPGSGVATGNGSHSQAYIYNMGGNHPIIDYTGGVITQVFDEQYNALIPTVTLGVIHDIYGDSAMAIDAIYPRRLSVRTLRYDTGTVTPSGTNQTIDVTGKTKVIVTPPSITSITSATFTATLFAGADASRNGDLIIEAGNDNLTINHSAAGANTFKLASGTNLTMTAGQIIRFMRSEVNGNWVQHSIS
jgi:hypothetical protein